MAINKFIASANNVYIIFNGEKVGLAKDFRASDDFAPDPATVIGEIHVQEYVPTVARHNITMSELRISAKKLTSVGGIVGNGDTALEGLVFDVEIHQKSGGLLKKYIDASLASGDISIQSNQIIVNSATFNALDAT